MAVQRPTFSEHWHRVEHLRPTLRATVQGYRQHYRGQLWHVLRDPTTNQFVRVDEAGYRFIGMLDGRNTVDAVWQACCEQLGDRAPTQNEAVQLLGQLYVSNLLGSDLPGDAMGLFERRQKRVRREVGSYLMNLLFARIPLWNPDHFLERWVPLVGWFFSPVGLVLWLVLLYFGLSAIAGRTDELFTQSDNVLAPDNLFWLYVGTVILKLIHELGHGFACKHFGRKSHTGGFVPAIGIMFMVLMPLPYVDASSAWALRSKWQRTWIGLAGMYAEMVVASMAAIVWSHTPAGSFWHGFAYNMIFVAGVSTLLFNLNPLIRFDGYYILCDLTDSPNLMQRSKMMLHYFVKRYAFGVEHPYRPTQSNTESIWLTFYSIAAFIYRVFLSIRILLFVSDKLFFVGAIMAVSGLIGWVIVPCGKFVHYLFVHQELFKTRRRAVMVTAVTLGTLALLLGVLPIPDHGRAEGVVEARHQQMIHAAADGEVQMVRPSGTQVTADRDILLSAENMELRSQRDQLAAQRITLQRRYDKALAQDAAAAQSLREQIDAVEQQLARVERDLSRLTIPAAFNGVWIVPDDQLLPGAYVRRGSPLGLLIDTSDLYIRATADQYLGPRLKQQLPADAPVQMRVRMEPDLHYTGTVRTIIPGGRRQLPSAALGMAGGGSLPVEMDRTATGVEAAEPFFEIDVELDKGQATQLLPGQRVVVRFDLPAKPLGMQLWRAVRQTLQRRFQI